MIVQSSVVELKAVLFGPLTLGETSDVASIKDIVGYPSLRRSNYCWLKTSDADKGDNTATVNFLRGRPCKSESNWSLPSLLII